MAIALVPTVRDIGQLPHLGGVQRAVGNGDPQHIGVQLQIEAVHQAQRLEFILGQRAVNAAFDLAAELGHACAHEGFVKVGVSIHS